MGPSASGNVASKLSLGLLNFVLAVSSGWALKHYSVDRYAVAGYGFLFAHSVFCILRYTHPNPGGVQRLLCEQSLRFAPTVFVTLIIGQMQSIVGKIQMPSDMDINYETVVFGLYSGIVILAIIRLIISCFNDKCALARFFAWAGRFNLGLCVLWNVYCLWRISIIDEYYWSLGLALLSLINHFVLWHLTLRFNITILEVDTVGMCFSIIFAINATQEQIADRK